jgi:hypothetical protein
MMVRTVRIPSPVSLAISRSEHLGGRRWSDRKWVNIMNIYVLVAELGAEQIKFELLTLVAVTFPRDSGQPIAASEEQQSQVRPNSASQPSFRGVSSERNFVALKFLKVGAVANAAALFG